MAHLTSLTGSLLLWLARYDYESILHVFARILKVILGSISWRGLLASGVAAMKLAISQLVL